MKPFPSTRRLDITLNMTCILKKIAKWTTSINSCCRGIGNSQSQTKTLVPLNHTRYFTLRQRSRVLSPSVYPMWLCEQVAWYWLGLRESPLAQSVEHLLRKPKQRSSNCRECICICYKWRSTWGWVFPMLHKTSSSTFQKCDLTSISRRRFLVEGKYVAPVAWCWLGWKEAL